jgi:hypothetical protein
MPIFAKLDVAEQRRFVDMVVEGLPQERTQRRLGKYVVPALVRRYEPEAAASNVASLVVRQIQYDPAIVPPRAIGRFPTKDGYKGEHWLEMHYASLRHGQLSIVTDSVDRQYSLEGDPGHAYAERRGTDSSDFSELTFALEGAWDDPRLNAALQRMLVEPPEVSNAA